MSEAVERVAASLWSTAPDDRLSEATRLRDQGVDLFHWDYSVGDFTIPGGTTSEQAAAISAATGARAEAHLMVADPLAHVDAWLPFCDLVAVHLETSTWLPALERIAAAGAIPALAIGPGTLLPDPFPGAAGAVLVMSVQPGYGGSTFDQSAIQALDDVPPAVLAGVDGGVTRELALLAREHGARWIVSGTDLVCSPDPRAWLTEVRDEAGRQRQ